MHLYSSLSPLPDRNRVCWDSLTVYVNGEEKGVMVKPGVQLAPSRADGKALPELELPLRWAADIVIDGSSRQQGERSYGEQATASGVGACVAIKAKAESAPSMPLQLVGTRSLSYRSQESLGPHRKRCTCNLCRHHRSKLWSPSLRSSSHSTASRNMDRQSNSLRTVSHNSERC